MATAAAAHPAAPPRGAGHPQAALAKVTEMLCSSHPVWRLHICFQHHKTLDLLSRSAGCAVWTQSLFQQRFQGYCANKSR